MSLSRSLGTQGKARGFRAGHAVAFFGVLKCDFVFHTDLILAQGRCRSQSSHGHCGRALNCFLILPRLTCGYVQDDPIDKARDKQGKIGNKDGHQDQNCNGHNLADDIPPRGTPDATLRQGEPASFTKRSIQVYTNNIDHAHHATLASRCHHLPCKYLDDGNRKNLSTTHFPFERVASLFRIPVCEPPHSSNGVCSP